MKIKDILTVERTIFLASLSSKKKALELLAQLIAQDISNTSFEEIFEAFIDREKLGSTAFGLGIAIPHCRFIKANEPIAAVVLLKNEITYDEGEEEKINLLFALVVPQSSNSQHLTLLSLLTKKFRQSNFIAQLKQTKSRQEFYELLICE